MTSGDQEASDKLLKRKRDVEHPEGISEISREHTLESLADLFAAFSGSPMLSEAVNRTLPGLSTRLPNRWKRRNQSLRLKPR